MKLITLLKKVRNRIMSKSILLKKSIQFLAEKKILPKIFWNRLPPIGIFKLKINGNVFLYDALENDYISRRLIWTNFRDWEALSVSIFYEFSKISNSVLDIGSYTGVYSLIACTANNACEVSIFEPNPIMIPNIERNHIINNFIDRIKIYNIALSDENGIFEFGITNDRTASSLIANITERENIDSLIKVKVWKLDDLFDQENPKEANLVKIDVEGNELKTLKGMKRIIEYNKPVFLIECLSENKYREIENHLKGYGYYNKFHVGKNILTDISKGFRNEEGNPNYLFLPNDKSMEIVSKFLLTS